MTFSDVFWTCLVGIHREFQKHMSFLQYRKVKGEEKQESQSPPPKSHIATFLGGHGLDE